ncbi:MAG: 16S rRNA (cytidine(1402)-2'-O)-methyltransferase [Gammaproteobacteria bacterium]
MSNAPGTLFVVATPIGNLEDLSPRARRILGEVDLIAAEDTRHSRVLLGHFSISTPTVAYHDHNERAAAADLVRRLQRGQDIALITDAGTPLISDPGYRLVNLAHEAGIPVVPVPGPSALMCALSCSGLPVHRFAFEGYAPERPSARRKWLARLRTEPRTMVFFEAPHRVQDFLKDCVATFGPERQCTIARELTKKFETVRRASLGKLLEWMCADSERCLGEMVIVLEGTAEGWAVEEQEAVRVLEVLLDFLPVRDAAAAAAGITGWKKNELYTLGLRIRKADG